MDIATYIADLRRRSASQRGQRTHYASDRPAAALCSADSRYMAPVAAPTSQHPLCGSCRRTRIALLAREEVAV